jgi:phage terminase large subunit
MFSITTATKKIFSLKKRIKVIPGGTSAGKTIGIEQVLIDRCQRDSVGDITSVVSESYPHLKRGAMRDFIKILQEQKYYQDSRWNRTTSTYTFETGAQLEFFSADQPDKVRGPRRKRLFMNEANNMPFDTFEQLEVRTTDEIFIDFNPTNEFWYYTEIKGKRSDYEELVLTYKDNEALDPAIVASIEQRKDRKGWWQVYGEGKLGEVEGKIYRNWLIIDDIPHEARLERLGLDFGYSNDPSAIVAVYYYNGGYILDEITYQKGLSNKQLADIINNIEKKCIVIADSAEPKSIDEIRGYGITILPTKKGTDSVRQGIQFVQDQAVSVTKRSVNIIKEYRNYLWKTDKDGKILNEPEHTFSHSMDAIRYALTSIETKTEDTYIQPPYHPTEFEGTREQETRHIATETGGRIIASSDYQQSPITE